MAFQSAQPRPRAQVALSAARTVLYIFLLSPVKKVQAIAVSQAGSPTPETPKSITALSRPWETSRLTGLTSPWNHTGGPCHAAKGRLPDLSRKPGVDLAIQGRDRLPGLGVPVGQRDAEEAGVIPGRRAVIGIDLVQDGEETGQVGSELTEVRDVAAGCGLTIQSAIDRPRPRITAPWGSLCDRLRDRQRQMPGEFCQPPVLLADLRDVAFAAGQAHGHVVAKAERDVVVPVEFNGADGKVSPLRKLSRD
jgi:hypothetical protein